MEICSICYPAKLPSNNGFIYIRSSITNFIIYFWKLTDAQGNVFTGPCSPAYDSGADFIINPLDAKFIKGMFEPFSGTYILQVVDPYDQPQNFTFGGKKYGCIAIEFYDLQTPEIISLIQ